MRTKARNQTTVFQNPKEKFPIRGKIENHLIPYNFDSKGDNLRKVDFRIEFEAIC